MCGIAGMYTFKSNDLQPGYFKWCLSTMRHRGPDAQSIWHNNKNYITAFARLSIRDRSTRGDQPMRSECGNFCISFNGEIYNTDCLLAALLPYRSSYFSSTDTELLLYALIHLGIAKTLEIADGMFAFAFYDLQKNRLILAMDPLGIKPLYIGESSEGIVYSSQYDHIINHSFFRRQSLDANAIASYLWLGYMPENMGVLQQTKLFPHGHYMIVENGTVQLHQYYSYRSQSSVDTSENIEHALAGSVNSQLVSDVPVGTFMSGGVDSTLVSYFANREKHFKSFTIGIKDSVMDETDAAKAFAEKFNIDHYCQYISSGDMLQLFNDNAKAFTEPFADYSSLPVLMLSKFAKEKVTVALSGDGADELFWGYPRNRKALGLIPSYKKNLWNRRMGLLLAKIKDPATVHLSRHWNNKNFLEYYYLSLAVKGAAYWLPQVFRAQPASPFFFQESLKYLAEETTSTAGLMNIIRKMEIDIHLQRILLKVDRASMYHSLEVRVPFLSKAMLQYSRSCSYDDCIKGIEGKMNIKQSLINKAGEALVLKPKKGFTIPIDDWLRKDIKAEATEKIMDMPPHLAVMFNREKLQQLLQKHMEGSQQNGWFIWAVYSFVQWDAFHRNKFS